ncbi:hypothetical protein GWK47_043887 [Chionoecetes opilio]|uniref:Uncharacterized protein n=1 Tax=Chionoecetes opilio TaxID=41210 RepID=A0A8J4Y9X8_CHIOP|nr:hypothetical protein GWK47_043887 [Chionoecetes opilio]
MEGGGCTPYCLYGSEVTQYREGDIMHLEKTQNIVGRWGLGACRSTAVEAIRGDMGWSTFRERIIKGKLVFHKKIERLSDDRWAKKISQENRSSSTWKKELERWKRRETVGEEWNRMEIIDIKKKIENNGLVKWQEGMARKSTLQWCRWKQKPEGVTWHVGDWGSKLLYKARTGTLEVNGRNRELENQNCSCRVGEKETVEHVIVECNKYRSQREKLIASIVIVLGREEWDRRRVFDFEKFEKFDECFVSQIKCKEVDGRRAGKLEVVQNRVGRLALEANRYVAVEAIGESRVEYLCGENRKVTGQLRPRDSCRTLKDPCVVMAHILATRRCGGYRSGPPWPWTLPLLLGLSTHAQPLTRTQVVLYVSLCSYVSSGSGIDQDQVVLCPMSMFICSVQVLPGPGTPREQTLRAAAADVCGMVLA